MLSQIHEAHSVFLVSGFELQGVTLPIDRRRFAQEDSKKRFVLKVAKHADELLVYYSSFLAMAYITDRSDLEAKRNSNLTDAWGAPVVIGNLIILASMDARGNPMFW